MRQPAKYLFDRQLDATAAPSEPPELVAERRLRTEFERELAEARKAEYDRGRAEGVRTALQSLEAQTREAAGQLVENAAALLEGLESECRAIRAEAVRIALMASERFAGELVRRDPTALLEAMFARCLENLATAPHVAIRVNDALAEPLQKKVSAIAAERGFSGKVIVLGDPETDRGDCRIEWADGGIARDFDSLRRHIAGIVQRHLEASHSSRAACAGAPKANGAAPASPAAAAVPHANATTAMNGSGEG